MNAKKPHNKRFIFTLFFMNHMLDKTGVSRVMLGHQKMYLEHGISYVSAFIIRRAYLGGRIEAFNEYGLLVDGEYQGVFTMVQLTAIMADWNEEDIYCLDFHIHHFLHVKLRDVEYFLDTFPDIPVKVYLHDFYTECQSYNLMKNDVEYCGGNGFREDTCGGCRYYAASKVYEDKLKAFFDIYLSRILFIAPSESTKRIFSNFHNRYSGNVRVIPHLKFQDEYKGDLSKLEEDSVIKIAFLGYRNPRKGWEVWKKLCEKFRNDLRFEFYILNSDDLEYSVMKKIHVQFTENKMNAMTEALREHGIHAVFLWSVWPETYSYTCFESYAANAYILTHKDSGNIADTIKEYGNGRIFENKEELDRYLEDINNLRYDINLFRTKGKPGPLEMIDNDEIIGLSTLLKSEKRIINKVSGKAVNPVLMWILNRHYGKKYGLQ